MKNYVKPSIEISKFSVEDIMSNSGVMGGKADMTAAGQNLYEAYKTANTVTTDAANIVEFNW